MKRLLSPSTNDRSMKKLLAFVMMITTIAALVPLNVFARYESGMHDGYFYSLWTNDTGTVNYQNKAGSRYTVSWNNQGLSPPLIPKKVVDFLKIWYKLIKGIWKFLSSTTYVWCKV